MWFEGSSPRGRGKPTGRAVNSLVCGLIPAWAGKTESIRTVTFKVSAHPRVGGENRTVYHALFVGVGSSPRGRGKPACAVKRNMCSRLIPAWAGKTRSVGV